MNKTQTLVVSLILFSASLGSHGAIAQSRVDSLLEEVVVTARKREEGLQDAPISISAFSGDSLEYRGITNIGQIADFSPNLSFQNNPSFGGSSNAAAVYIRGVGQKEFLPTTEPGVGLYVDGVYVARSVGAILDLIEVERIEVLRGPQGTLFGRNTIGGAVSVTTRKPADEFSGRVSLTAGTDSRIDFKGSLSAPFSDTFRSLFSIASFNRDGYLTRLDGVELGDDDTLTARAAFQWDLSDKVLIDMAVETSRDRENGPPIVLLGINFAGPIDPETPPMATIHNVGANLLAGGPPAPCAFPGMELNLAVAGCYDNRYVGGIDFNAGTAPAFSESDLTSGNVNLSWNISDSLAFKSITAFRDLDSEFSRDGDHSPFVVSQFFDSLEQQQFTQEFQILGSSDKYDWIAGLYYFEEDGNNINLLDFTVSSFRSGGQFDNTAIAAYGQLTYNLTEQLSLTLGLRYTEEDKIFLPDQIILNNPFAGSGNPQLDAPFLQVGSRILPLLEKEISIQETTPLVNLSYRFTNNLMGYFTYSEGFKSGGFTQRVFPPIVAPFTAPAGTADIDLIPTFDPEFVEVFELGMKYSSADNRLRINGAVFSTDYTDIQVQVFTSVAPVTRNAGTASIRGFELEGQYIPKGGWLIDFGIGYLDAGFDEIDQATTFLTTNSEFERVPEWSFNAAVSREFAMTSGAVVIPRVDGSYRSETFNDSFNTPQIAQDAYSIVNASLTWESANSVQSLSLGVTNLTDEDYLVTGVIGDAFQSFEGVFARPREWYLSYSYNF